MLNYEVPPHLQSLTTQKSSTTEITVGTGLAPDHHASDDRQPNVNIDEEVAAGLNVIDHDEEIALALKAGWSGNKEPAQQSQHDTLQNTTILHPRSSLDSEIAHQTQHSSFEATKNAEYERKNLPPHLRIFHTARSESQSDQKTSAAQAKPGNAHGLEPALTARNKTPLDNPGDILYGRPGKTVHLSNGATRPPKVDSAVKAGKRPVGNSSFLNEESGLANWDGGFVPPPQGEDWADRDLFECTNPERECVIEAWRDGQEIGFEANCSKLDTESLAFQTGTGLVGGNGEVLSPIDDAEHEAIPNEDDFSQVHRDQSAAAAIETFRAQIAAKRRSIKDGEDDIRNEMNKPVKRNHKRDLRYQDPDHVVPRNRHAPEANIYLRPAEFNDMRQCTEIYNQWAEDTSFTVTVKPVDGIFWEDCFRTSQKERTPFLVAVHMGQKHCNDIRDVRRKKKETIVGFSMASNYGAEVSVYRYSIELELYVDRQHLRQGIGRTMLDRMLGALDQGYTILECAPLLLADVQSEMSAWVGGGIPIVKTVVVNLLYSAERDRDNVEWKRKWLSGGRNEFEHAGTIRKIGYKFLKP